MASNFIYDNAEASFKDGDEMELFVRERAHNTQWLTEGIRDVRFNALHDEPICAPEYARQMGVSAISVEDTMQGAGLTLVTSIGTRPVGASAVKSVADRAGVTPGGFEKLRNGNRESLKTVLNLMFDVSSGAIQVKLADEKIRAVHSARYATLDNEKLFGIIKNYFATTWPKSTFKEGYFSHEQMREVFDLSAYKADFFGRLPADSVVKSGSPVFVMASSDIATSAIRLIPSMDLGGVIVPLSKEICIPHLGEDIEGRVAGAMEALLAYFEGAAADLNALSAVQLRHGKNALIRVLKSNAFPKSCAGEAVEGFCAMYAPDEQVTAMDVYLAACDAYSNVCRDHAMDKKKIFAAADGLARVARTRWADVDLPGEVEL